MKSSILVIDDEKNIRLTLTKCLEPLGYSVNTAVNAEEAFKMMNEQTYGLILLDLKLPGMDGIDFLKRIKSEENDVSVIIITAHGTIETAVEAMKLGAVDYIQKPFAPTEIRDLVKQVLERKTIDESKAEKPSELISIAKKYINKKKFEKAMEHVKAAIIADPMKPEYFNLLGVLMEITGDLSNAEKNYKAAVSLNPDFVAAKQNLHRLMGSEKISKDILLNLSEESS